MDTQNIVVDRLAARALYRKYRAHQHYSTPIDDEIRRCYQLIAQGRLVIKALESIVAAGVGEDGYPKLAIVRADAEKCFLEYRGDGSARFAAQQWVKENHRRNYIDFPAGSFPEPPYVRPSSTRPRRRACAGRDPGALQRPRLRPLLRLRWDVRQQRKIHRGAQRQDRRRIDLRPRIELHDLAAG